MTKAFDLALFVPTPVNSGDGVVVDVPRAAVHHQVRAFGHRLRPRHCRRRLDAEGECAEPDPDLGARPELCLGARNQSRRGGGVPPATANHQMLMADASLTLGRHHHRVVMGLGNAVTTTSGGDFTPSAKLTFQTTATPSVCIDGRDPTLSIIDNFTFDSGVFKPGVDTPKGRLDKP